MDDYRQRNHKEIETAANIGSAIPHYYCKKDFDRRDEKYSLASRQKIT